MSVTRKIFIFVIVAVIITVMVILNIKKTSSRVLEVTAEKIKRGNITQVISGSGKVQPEVDVRISARISAEIINLPIQEGDYVKKGDLLVELDRQRYEAAVVQYSSNLKSAQASLIKAQADFNRVKDLFEKNLSSQANLDAARADLLYAEANVEQAQAALSQAEDDLSKTIINAPIDGVVTKLNKEQGEIALGSQFQAEVIMTVADLSKMEVVAEIDENDVVLVSLSDKAKIEVDAVPDTHFIGRVTEIAHSATTRGLGTQEEVTNFEVNIAIASDVTKLRPGMSATVDIETETRNDVLYVPIQAITVRAVSIEEPATTTESKKTKAKQKNLDVSGNDGAKDDKELPEVVFIVQDNFAKMVPVKTGISSDTDMEIVEGLSDDAMVITGSFKALSTLLKDGMEVKVKNSGVKEEKD